MTWWLEIGVRCPLSAFDTVDHDLLLQRLERQFGLCGTVLQSSGFDLICQAGHSKYGVSSRIRGRHTAVPALPSHDTIRDTILTGARKLTSVSLIYPTEPTTKKCKTEKLKSKKRICSEVGLTVNM